MKRAIAVVGILTLGAMGCAGQPAAGQSDAAAPVAAATGPPPGPPQPMDFGPVVAGTAPDNPYSAAQIRRGDELVAFGGCNDCHTPWNIDPELGMPAPDMSRMLSGHPAGAPDPQGSVGPTDIALIGPSFTSFALPFGITYSLNLTPDMQTGSGSWTEEMFLSIFRKVKHLGGDGRTIMPPMPWPAVASLPDEDIVAIFAYLRSIPPIVNTVPSVKVPEEVIMGIGMGNDVLLGRMRAQSQQR